MRVPLGTTAPAETIAPSLMRTNRRAIVLLKSFTVLDLPGNYAVTVQPSSMSISGGKPKRGDPCCAARLTATDIAAVTALNSGVCAQTLSWWPFRLLCVKLLVAM